MQNKIIEYLEFDSKLFNYKTGKALFSNIYKIENHHILTHIKKNNYKLVYLAIEDIHKLNRAELSNAIKKFNELGAKLIDKKILFSKNIKTKQEINEITSYNSSTLTQKLLDLNYQSGKYSRFKKDKNFRNREFELLYKIWIEKSLNHSIADKVFVKYMNKEIAGFLTVKAYETYAEIGLISVDTNHRGKKIGQKLIKKAEEFTFNKGLSELKVATQWHNTGAVNFYKKNGFIEDKINYIYHLWLK